jgi:uncharacterized protein (TIGR02001 family)
MYLSRYLTALLGAFAVSAGALADEPASPHSVSYNMTLTSDYIYRGQTQTNGGPALQLGVDYKHASGFYFSAWASNISWLRDNYSYTHSNIETDFYAGYAAALSGTDVNYDLGLGWYEYPGDKNAAAGFAPPSATETIAKLNYKWLTGIFHATVTPHDSQVDNARGSNYWELNADVPVNETGLTANLHVGTQYYAGNIPGHGLCPSGENSNNACYGYSDWMVGATQTLPGRWSVNAQFTRSSNKAANYTFRGENIGRGLFAVSVQKRWGAE